MSIQWICDLVWLDIFTLKFTSTEEETPPKKAATPAKVPAGKKAKKAEESDEEDESGMYTTELDANATTLKHPAPNGMKLCLPDFLWRFHKIFQCWFGPIGEQTRLSCIKTDLIF